MASEIQFILDLLLNYNLPEETTQVCLKRIGDVEASLRQQAPAFRVPLQTNLSEMPKTPNQSPSTLANLAKHGMIELPIQPEIIAQTPAAALALQQRQQAIAIATSGKLEEGRTSPRKF